MIVKTKIIMDLLKPTLCPVINAVQGDTYSRGIDISLFAAGVVWEIPDDVTAAVRYRKRDGTKGYYDTLPDGSAAWSAANNVLTVLFAPQMLTVAGPVVTQIEMIQGAKVLATFSMRLIVEENPAAGVLESEDYINWLQWMEAELDAYLEKAKVNGEYVGGKMLGPINMDGHTLSGLNAPTEETQAANKGYVDGAVKTARPRNLLDNSDFRSPVNQRGFTGGEVADRQLIIDRWLNYDHNNAYSPLTVSMTENGLTLSPNGKVSLSQYFPDVAKYIGKVLTLAVGLADGTVYVTNGVVPSEAWVAICEVVNEKLHAWIQTYNGVKGIVCVTPRQDITVSWAALYEGEYTADTLPEYQPKGYGVELTECRRYLRPLIPAGREVGYLCNITEIGYLATFYFGGEEMYAAPSLLGAGSMCRFVGRRADHTVAIADSLAVDLHTSDKYSITLKATTEAIPSSEITEVTMDTSNYGFSGTLFAVSEL